MITYKRALTLVLVLFIGEIYRCTAQDRIPISPQKIEFDKKSENPAIKLLFAEQEDAYLQQLKKEYPLTAVLEAANNSMDTLLRILEWTHSRWIHDGRNTPKEMDAISILQEAAAGGRFPCFAYAIVLRDQLNALGFKARVIYLKAKNARDSQVSPGHVATEVYLTDWKKWVFLDGQFNVLPRLKGVPLNAVEFQKAISRDYKQLELVNAKGSTAKSGYVNFVYYYLYYFDTSLDTRYDPDEPNRINGKRSLMLVPIGAENLTYIDLWDLKVDYCIYTTALKDFYPTPY